MHVFVRSSHILNRRYNFIKSCPHSNPAIRCLCGSLNAENNKCQSSYQVRFRIPYNYTNSILIRNLRSPYSIDLLKRKTIADDLITRTFSLSTIKYDKEPLKPSSKVEVTVQEIKKQKEELPVEVKKTPVKKSLKQKIIDECMHYYHGFRLLFIDVKISSGLVWRILHGKSLTRREHRLLIRTVGDMFRLVPFSVFIVVPFMEFLLPFFIKFFPGMLPSTFQTAAEEDAKIKKNLKVKLEMAKFLQQTLDEMAVQHKDHRSEQAKEFVEWFKKVRESGGEVTNTEIMKYSKLFEDEITLDSLTRSQLIALCRVLEITTLGTNNLLRFQLRMKLRSLAADDKMIQKEGVNSLTLYEVQQACRARGMRAYGLSEVKLRTQLQQWLDLSLNEKVPPSLLLLTRAMMLPETIPTHDKLKATISALPETIMTQTQAAIGEKEGKIDNKVKLEVLKEEERKIKEERHEQREERKKQKQEELIDKAPILTDKAAVLEAVDALPFTGETSVKTKATEEQIRAKDFEAIEHAVDSISNDCKKFVLEKEVIEDLKEEMLDYEEDVHELKQATANEIKPVVKESKAAQRLFKRVNKMVTKLDGVLADLQSKEKQLKKELEAETTDKKKQELLRIDDIMAAIRKIQEVSDESRISQIKNILGKIDDDRDGSVKVEDVLKVIEVIGKDNVQLSSKQIDEIIVLLDKEEILEVEDKIEKALQKGKETQAAKDDSSCAKAQASVCGGSQQAQQSKSDTQVKTSSPVQPPTSTASAVPSSPPTIGVDATTKKDNSQKTL